MRQNKKHGFDQYTKGGHFCAAHMALSRIEKVPRGIQGEMSRKDTQVRENWSQQLEHKQVPNTGTHILKMKEKKLIIFVTCSNVKTTASTK